MKIVISKKQWEGIGRKAGWMGESEFDVSFTENGKQTKTRIKAKNKDDAVAKVKKNHPSIDNVICTQVEK